MWQAVPLANGSYDGEVPSLLLPNPLVVSAHWPRSCLSGQWLRRGAAPRVLEGCDPQLPFLVPEVKTPPPPWQPCPPPLPWTWASHFFHLEADQGISHSGCTWPAHTPSSPSKGRSVFPKDRGGPSQPPAGFTRGSTSLPPWTTHQVGKVCFRPPSDMGDGEGGLALGSRVHGWPLGHSPSLGPRKRPARAKPPWKSCRGNRGSPPGSCQDLKLIGGAAGRQNAIGCSQIGLPSPLPPERSQPGRSFKGPPISAPRALTSSGSPGWPRLRRRCAANSSASL